MALAICPDCQTQVSDQAPACPRCGRPLRAPPKKSNTGLVILIVVLVSIVPVMGILASLAVYGVRKYIANAKTAEARNTLGQIGKDAAAAYEANGSLCASASAAVPADRSNVSGRKYMAAPDEWTRDRASNAGFACLKFEMPYPQYYQYSYEATSTSFVARARGDLNGDGVFSLYELHGQVVGGQLRIAPSIMETDPTE